MRQLTLALSTAALALSSAAFAQAPAHTPGHTSGAHTLAAQPDMTRAQAQARAEAAFARMDGNRDGTFNQADRTAMHAQMFDRMDTDRNGSISRAEFDAMHAKRAANQADSPHGGKGGKGGHKMDGHDMGGHKMGGQDMNGHDMGGHDMGGKAPGAHHGGMMGANTTITRQAFVDRALSMFDRADANRDGTVTQAERKAARETLRSQWQARSAKQQG